MSRRSHITAAIGALSVLVMASGTLFIRGGSTPVDVDEAVERFRAGIEIREDAASKKASGGSNKDVAEKKATTTSSQPQEITGPEVGLRPYPAEGVYVYATTGGDDVSVLGGASHTYPPETTVTLEHAGCGLVERWDALDERWDERETCRTPKGDELGRFTSYHEFYRVSDSRTYDCSGFAYPEGAQPGDTWTGRCRSGESVTEQAARAVAFETLDVGGTAVKTLHVRVETKLTGEQEGGSMHEVWGDLRTGLAIKERSKTTSYSMQPVFGRTRYHEEYEIRLKSLTPRS